MPVTLTGMINPKLNNEIKRVVNMKKHSDLSIGLMSILLGIGCLSVSIYLLDDDYHKWIACGVGGIFLFSAGGSFKSYTIKEAL